MMWTEAAIKQRLDGTFTVVDSNGRHSTVRVPVDFMPKHVVTQAPRERKGGRPARWQAHEDRKLRWMRAAGATYEAIGAELDRSEDSIRTRIKLLRRRGRWGE